MAEPKITVLANLGDAYPLDYGGHIVFQAEEPNGRITYHSELWDQPLKDRGKDIYEVYRWDIEPDAVEDLDWADINWVADSIGMDRAEFEASGRSEDPRIRALFYENVGRHSGFSNLDAYPVRFSRKEMEKRWPQFK